MEIEEQLKHLSIGLQQATVMLHKHQEILEYHQTKAEQLLRMEKRIQYLENAVKGLGWL